MINITVIPLYNDMTGAKRQTIRLNNKIDPRFLWRCSGKNREILTVSGGRNALLSSQVGYSKEETIKIQLNKADAKSTFISMSAKTGTN